MVAAKSMDSLFRWVEAQEANASSSSSTSSGWGRVLDAGTGRHSLQWLTGLDGAVAEIVAVTGEQPLAEQLQREFEDNAHGIPVHVHAGNWMDEAFLAQEAPFDVIVADYLIGSIEGFAPYYQDEILPRLKKLLASDGRLYIVGLHPLTESAPSSTTSCQSCASGMRTTEVDSDGGARLVQDMARLRDACILLAGRRVYREFPLAWTQRQLERSGLHVRGSIKMANVYTADTIGRQIQVARNQLKWFQDDALAATMRESLERFEVRVADALGGGQRKLRFGFDYVVAATPSIDGLMAVANKNDQTVM